ncbi:peptidase M1-like protein [Saccharopolyspora erythraea NRRL 2338]|uniref:Aminopeptidase N n=2 Tax=Saccharopolyspora erythraea TaxID=1836 RepID=A4FPV0_SACEN|nr:M1 family metallopeptidase [Saccharopolyspora erythraea]EQD84550.1 peptidase [Saccharopolyspora erythraea D]PFG99720.1 peptidase M1-like protein [Saccharopolyspora erythraea NRRL 2338]QRK89602.1 M1 family metallopeptidase [Saccharopolyspora erythraea]CAM06075.1 metallopeptidase [Saccharopolyspora erythraea NRRL 2338]
MFRRQGLRVAAAACCAAAFLATPALAGSDGPGAPGVGDDYFPGYGNGGYDVSHYDVQVRYRPADDYLQGTTTIVAKPTQNLTAFNLDFALKVKSVLVNGQRAQFEHDGLELTVTPPRTLPQGSLATFVVEYDGVPSTVEAGGIKPWIRTADGALAIGQPEISSWWFPGNDHPRDKATFDIAVTVPDGTEVLANGVNTGKSSLAGQTTWQWRTTKPTATYLAFMAVGQYEISTKPGAFGQPFVTAYSDKLGEYEGAAKASIERTPEVVEFLSGLFGEYPFEAQGGVATSEGMSFALENQTRPTYSHLFFRRGANMSVVVHEIAHQWFGDSISVDTWRNIWLNEGFASYAEWLWSEAQGTGTAQQLFDHYYSSTPADDPFWQVKPGDPGAANVFHGAVYDRGAMTLHALRNVVGDAALLDITRTWVAEKRYQTGTIEEFIELAEQRSGKQLDEFFEAWLFTPGKPAVGAATGVPASATTASLVPPPAVAEIDAVHERVHDHD